MRGGWKPASEASSLFDENKGLSIRLHFIFKPFSCEFRTIDEKKAYEKRRPI
jgi:hypothetical protein